MRLRSLVAVISVAALTPAITLVISGSAIADSSDSATPPAATSGTCAPYDRTENGVCAKPGPTKPAPTSGVAAAQAREKKAVFSRRCAGCVARDPGFLSHYQIWSVRNMTLLKEGQGNWDSQLGHPKAYTCGPAATRNMVTALYKTHRGHWRNIAEHRFELWENTTRSGTSAATVARTLNNHFSAFGSWSLHRPATKAKYLKFIKWDSYVYKQSVIKSLDTEFLDYFNKKALNHFDMDFGYRQMDNGGWQIRIAEEWNPKFIYGGTPSYGNPYGKHWVSLRHAYTAVKHTSYHYMVV